MAVLYDKIGVDYDHTRQADPVIVNHLVSLLDFTPHKKTDYFLDLACGTGNYTKKLSQQGGFWFGADLSKEMLFKAHKKNPEISFVQANAEILPFPSSFFSGILCTLALHHFPSITQVITEVARVLKAGNIVFLTATPEQMRGYWLNEYFPKALEKSIQQMPSLEKIQSALETANLYLTKEVPFFIQPELKDFFLYSGKQRPEIYLSKECRDGISTFANLADPQEVEQGCLQLQQDIQSGQFKTIQKKYENKLGDYLFLQAALKKK